MKRIEKWCVAGIAVLLLALATFEAAVAQNYTAYFGVDSGTWCDPGEPWPEWYYIEIPINADIGIPGVNMNFFKFSVEFDPAFFEPAGFIPSPTYEYLFINENHNAFLSQCPYCTNCSDNWIVMIVDPHYPGQPSFSGVDSLQVGRLRFKLKLHLPIGSAVATPVKFACYTIGMVKNEVTGTNGISYTPGDPNHLLSLANACWEFKNQQCLWYDNAECPGPPPWQPCWHCPPELEEKPASVDDKKWSQVKGLYR